MLPNSLVTLLAFLLVVAPGAYAESLYERRQPARTDSSLREASRISLSSITFTVASTILIAGFTHVTGLGPSLNRIVNDAKTHPYLHAHYLGVVLLVLCEFLLALALARFAHFWLTRSSPRSWCAKRRSPPDPVGAG